MAVADPDLGKISPNVKHLSDWRKPGNYKHFLQARQCLHVSHSTYSETYAHPRKHVLPLMTTFSYQNVYLFIFKIREYFVKKKKKKEDKIQGT
jgi:hypothetical protein